MNSRMKLEGLLFTLFIGIVMAAALWFARDWPIRASIGVLVLGSSDPQGLRRPLG